jgi:solute carrier family 6 amino acid transporter-like protein 5/7/9/14
VKLFAVLFFLMLITLAIGSAAGLTSCVTTILCDDFPSVKRWIITAIVCVASFFIGLIYLTPVRRIIASRSMRTYTIWS